MRPRQAIMKSMTGFGRGERSGDTFSVTVELKTVNNRFLDVNLRLPNELSALENELKRIASERLSRGRLDVNIQYEIRKEIEYELNRPLIKGYLSVLKELAEDFELPGSPDINQVARLPNALQTKTGDLPEEFTSGLTEAFGDALDALEEMRSVEGDSLKTVLIGLLDSIDEKIPLVESEAEKVSDEFADRLRKKVEGVLSRSDSDVQVDEARLAQEVAYLAEKSDISEETARLRSHVEQFRSIVGESGPIGKRLDFLTQELNREANTISSKTQNMIVKQAALDMKAEIEKIREQIQNIE